MLSRLRSVLRVRDFFITVISSTEKDNMKIKKKINLPHAAFDTEEEVIFFFSVNILLIMIYK